MTSLHTLTLLAALICLGLSAAEPAKPAATPALLKLQLRQRDAHGRDSLLNQNWLPSQTALILCDMWDLHHCQNAVIREKEMAPRLNAVAATLREQGVLIIHAPSSCMAAYAEHPARKRAQAAPSSPDLPTEISQWCKQLPSERGVIYPLDQSDGGEDDDPKAHAEWAASLRQRGLNEKAPWTRQIDLLKIDAQRDAISDSGVEIWNLLAQRGIQRVILAGVHLNMCVAGRPFGLRQMARHGKQVVLLRDLTDTMYNPARWPFVSHREGTKRFISYVEQTLCPTISSEQILGGQPFTFSAATEGPKRLRILLLGDSTTEASFPKRFAANEPQFEDSLRIRLACEPGLPPCDVINEGVSGETIRRLLDTRYAKAVEKQPKADWIFIRYGINDRSKLKHFPTDYPRDFKELVSRLHRDHPGAKLVPMTAIPYAVNNLHEDINKVVREAAAAEKLEVFDIVPRYLAELKKQPDGLNYRRFALSRVPEALRPLATAYLDPSAKDPSVVVLDARLDPLLGHLPGWAGDRHPSLAGYNAIADETARWLSPRLKPAAAKP